MAKTLPTTTTPPEDPPVSSLVGLFFHHYDGSGTDGIDGITHQGVIVGEPSPNLFLLEYFSWLDGTGSGQYVLVTLDALLTGYRFYRDVIELRWRGDECNRRRREART